MNLRLHSLAIRTFPGKGGGVNLFCPADFRSIQDYQHSGGTGGFETCPLPLNFSLSVESPWKTYPAQFSQFIFPIHFSSSFRLFNADS